MAWPTAQQWIFAVKTMMAALLALLVSLWIALPNPYWAVATVYIASNPLSGATRSKAIFRVIGTCLGAIAAVVMVPNLANEPPLLVIALATWSAVCLYISLLDRTPRSYVFMLAGYTAALIGFPTVNEPGTIFDVALSRTEEITVGILCAAVVSSVVFPQSVAAAIANRLRAWIANADLSARDALGLKTGREADDHRLRLAGDTGDIENLGTHLVYDAGDRPELLSLIRDIQPRMLMLIPILSSIADRLQELSLHGGPTPSTSRLVDRIDEWLRGDKGHDVTELELLRADVVARIDSGRNVRDWYGLVEQSLFVRLNELLEIRADCLEALKYVEGSDRPRAPFSYKIENRASLNRHYDHGLALLSAIVSFTTISVCCAFWIMTAWPEGSFAVLMAAIVGNLFSAQDNPVPSIVTFAKGALVSIAVSAIYVFAILPHVHNFETLALALAPTLVVIGLCISNPQTLLVGLSLAICVAAMIGLQVKFAVDAAAFWNGSLATAAGAIVAAVTASLLRMLGAQWSIQRLAKANNETLSEIAGAQTSRDYIRLTGVMLDRLVLLGPRAKAAEHKMSNAIGELREGFCMLELRRARMELSSHPRRRVDAVFLTLKRHHQTGAKPSASEVLRAAIDRSLAIVSKEMTPSAREALLSLVGLRLALFPNCAPPRMPHASALLETA